MSPTHTVRRTALATLAATLAWNWPGSAWAQRPQLGIYHELVMREPHVAPADHRLYYGGNLQQFGDLRLPKGAGPYPVAIVIHGGAWGSGVSLHYMSPAAAALTCAGVATWNIEYRRLGGGGGWPATFKDVAAAADFLRELAPTYRLDLNRVIATGHSAGGHLALWLAARHQLPTTAEVYAATPLALKGVVALGSGGAADLAHFVEAVPRFRDTVVELLGGTTPELLALHTAQGSPAELLPLGLPQVLISGELDPTVPLATVQRYAAQATAKGDKVSIVSIPGGEHFVSADPANRVAGPAIRDSVLAQLGMSTRGTDRCVGPTRRSE